MVILEKTPNVDVSGLLWGEQEFLLSPMSFHYLQLKVVPTRKRHVSAKLVLNPFGAFIITYYSSLSCFMLLTLYFTLSDIRVAIPAIPFCLHFVCYLLVCPFIFNLSLLI